MSGEGCIVNGEVVIPGETRCAHWPRTCADAQKQSSSTIQPCDFCRFGPPEPPTRSDDNAISMAEAERRVVEAEGKRADALRRLALAAVAQPSSYGGGG